MPTTKTPLEQMHQFADEKGKKLMLSYDWDGHFCQVETEEKLPIGTAVRQRYLLHQITGQNTDYETRTNPETRAKALTDAVRKMDDKKLNKVDEKAWAMVASKFGGNEKGTQYGGNIEILTTQSDMIHKNKQKIEEKQTKLREQQTKQSRLLKIMTAVLLPIIGVLGGSVILLAVLGALPLVGLIILTAITAAIGIGTIVAMPIIDNNMMKKNNSIQEEITELEDKNQELDNENTKLRTAIKTWEDKVLAKGEFADSQDKAAAEALFGENYVARAKELAETIIALDEKEDGLTFITNNDPFYIRGMLKHTLLNPNITEDTAVQATITKAKNIFFDPEKQEQFGVVGKLSGLSAQHQVKGRFVHSHDEKYSDERKLGGLRRLGHGIHASNVKPESGTTPKYMVIGSDNKQMAPSQKMQEGKEETSLQQVAPFVFVQQRQHGVFAKSDLPFDKNIAQQLTSATQQVAIVKSQLEKLEAEQSDAKKAKTPIGKLTILASETIDKHLNLTNSDNPLTVFKGKTFIQTNGEEFTVGDTLTLHQLHMIARNDQNPDGCNINGTGEVSQQRMEQSYGPVARETGFRAGVIAARALVMQTQLSTPNEVMGYGGYQGKFHKTHARKAYQIDAIGLQFQKHDNDMAIGMRFAEGTESIWDDPKGLRATGDQFFHDITGEKKLSFKEMIAKIPDESGRYIGLSGTGRKKDEYKVAQVGEQITAVIDTQLIRAKVKNDFIRIYQDLQRKGEGNKESIVLDFSQYGTGCFIEDLSNEQTRSIFSKAVKEGQMDALKAISDSRTPGQQNGVSLIRLPWFGGEPIKPTLRKKMERGGLMFATSKDGRHITQNLNEPIFIRKTKNSHISLSPTQQVEIKEFLKTGTPPLTEDTKQALQRLVNDPNMACSTQNEVVALLNQVIQNNGQAMHSSGTLNSLQCQQLLGITHAATNGADSHVAPSNELDVKAALTIALLEPGESGMILARKIKEGTIDQKRLAYLMEIYDTDINDKMAGLSKKLQKDEKIRTTTLSGIIEHLNIGGQASIDPMQAQAHTDSKTLTPQNHSVNGSTVKVQYDAALPKVAQQQIPKAVQPNSLPKGQQVAIPPSTHSPVSSDQIADRPKTESTQPDGEQKPNSTRDPGKKPGETTLRI